MLKGKESIPEQTEVMAATGAMAVTAGMVVQEVILLLPTHCRQSPGFTASKYKAGEGMAETVDQVDSAAVVAAADQVNRPAQAAIQVHREAVATAVMTGPMVILPGTGLRQSTLLMIRICNQIRNINQNVYKMRFGCSIPQSLAQVYFFKFLQQMMILIMFTDADFFSLHFFKCFKQV